MHRKFFLAGLLLSAHIAFGGSPAVADSTTTFTNIEGFSLFDSTVLGQKIGGSASYGTPIRIDAAGSGIIPSDAIAVVLNFEITEPEEWGFISAYPCDSNDPGEWNGTSVIVFDGGAPTSTSAVIELSSSKFCLLSYGKTHLEVEAVAYAPSTSLYQTLVPARVLDTRMSDDPVTTQREIDVSGSAPVGSTVDLRITTIGAQTSSVVTVSDCGSNVISYAMPSGVTSTRPAMIPVSADQKICASASESIHVIIDLWGLHTSVIDSVYPTPTSTVAWQFTDEAFVISWDPPSAPAGQYYVASVDGDTFSGSCSTVSDLAANSCSVPATAEMIRSDRTFQIAVTSVSSIGVRGTPVLADDASILLEPVNPDPPPRTTAAALDEGMFITDGHLRPDIPTELSFRAGAFEPQDWVIASLWPDLAEGTTADDASVLGVAEVADDGSLSMLVTFPSSITSQEEMTVVVMGTTVPSGYRETTAVSSPRAPENTDGWDYVYGNPGPYDYSEFLEVHPTENGGAFLVGQWAGDFEGMSAGAAYRIFVQYRDSDGTVQWTKSPNLPASSVSHGISGGVDGTDTLYLRISGDDVLEAPPSFASGSMVTYSPSGTLRSQSLLEIGGAYNSLSRLAISPTEGFMAISGNVTNQVARRFNSDLALTGSVAIPEDLTSAGDYWSPVSRWVVPAPVDDGSYWVLGIIPRPLPHMEDALGFVHIEVNEAGELATGTTIKHFGYTCGDFDVPRATTESIWVYSCTDEEGIDGGGVQYFDTDQIHSFDPEDGSAYGRINGLSPEAENMSSYESWDASVPQLEVCYPDSTGADYCTTIGINENVAANQVTYSPDGGLAFLEIASGGAWTSLSNDANTLMTTWRIEESGTSTTWTLLAQESVQRGISVEATAPLSDETFVVAGSTTVAVDVRHGKIQTQSSTKRAFIDQRQIREAPNNDSEDTSNNEGDDTSAGGGSSPEGDSSTDGSGLVTIDGVRPLDTRAPDVDKQGATAAFGTPLRINIGALDDVPSDAAAVAVNITATAAEEWGFVAAYPCASTSMTEYPGNSNLNFDTGMTVANSAIVPLDDGHMCLLTYGKSDVIIDVVGYMSN